MAFYSAAWLTRHGRDAAARYAVWQVVDLSAHVRLAQRSMSAYLALLRDCGQMSSRTRGRASASSLAVGAQLMGLLSAAERLLASAGDAVTLCPRNHCSNAPALLAEGKDAHHAAGPADARAALMRESIPRW